MIEKIFLPNRQKNRDFGTMKKMILSWIAMCVFLYFLFWCSDANADKLVCHLFVDGFFEVEIRSEKSDPEGNKQEIFNATRVGKDTILFEVDSQEGNNVVFMVKPEEENVVIFTIKNIEKGTQFFFTGSVSSRGELFAVSW